MDALQYLKDNHLQFTPALEALKKGGKIVKFNDNGVVVEYVNKGGRYDFICAKDNSLTQFEDKHRVCIALTEDAFSNLPNSICLGSTCYQIVYTSCKPLPVEKIDGLEVLLATKKDAQFVFEHYSLHPNLKSIKRIITNKGMFIAKLNGENVGFVGYHEEGSIGLLEVLPEFRRKGIAKVLASTVINDALSKGNVPYAHIIQTNTASYALCSAIPSMQVCPQKICWLWLED